MPSNHRTGSEAYNPPPPFRTPVIHPAGIERHIARTNAAKGLINLGKRNNRNAAKGLLKLNGSRHKGGSRKMKRRGRHTRRR